MEETTEVEDLLYEDLYHDVGNGTKMLKTSIQEMEERLSHSLQREEDFQEKLKNAQKQIEALEEEKTILLRNISCLFKTAKLEVGRKDKQIKDLHSENLQLKMQVESRISEKDAKNTASIKCAVISKEARYANGEKYQENALKGEERKSSNASRCEDASRRCAKGSQVTQTRCAKGSQVTQTIDGMNSIEEKPINGMGHAEVKDTLKMNALREGEERKTEVTNVNLRTYNSSIGSAEDAIASEQNVASFSRCVKKVFNNGCYPKRDRDWEIMNDLQYKRASYHEESREVHKNSKDQNIRYNNVQNSCEPKRGYHSHDRGRLVENGRADYKRHNQERR